MGLFDRDKSNASAGTATNQLDGQAVLCTGLSGNELFCATLLGYNPGNILVGNSVYSLGEIGNFAANLHSSFGGEIPQYSNMISEGRRLALQRFEGEMSSSNAVGASGVSNEIIFHPGHIEFLSVGSSLYNQTTPAQGVMTSSMG